MHSSWQSKLSQSKFIVNNTTVTARKKDIQKGLEWQKFYYIMM